MLENEYNIKLPPFDDEADIEGYFNKLSEIYFPDGWSTSYDVSLGLLSFQKIDMYRDLKKHRETILSNPIVRVIGGDLSAIGELPFDIDECDLRHSYSTLLLSKQIDPKITSSILGHSDVRTTLDIYSHASTDMQISAVNVINNVFKE